jgi:hypothetical protein
VKFKTGHCGQNRPVPDATQPDNVAFDGGAATALSPPPWSNIVATPGVDIGTIIRRVRADVVAAKREKQVPWDHHR